MNKLDKNNFYPEAIDEMINNLQATGENPELLTYLHKAKNDYAEVLPSIYKKYQQDIKYACDNGFAVPYEELAGADVAEPLNYEVFDEYFRKLKKYVKENENHMEYVMDLISAKDRIEAVRVLMLETESNVKKYCSVCNF
jgi:hypothetical protein